MADIMESGPLAYEDIQRRDGFQTWSDHVTLQTCLIYRVVRDRDAAGGNSDVALDQAMQLT